MASLSQSGRGEGRPPSRLSYCNMNCKCENVSDIKVSMTTRNRYKLFYTCRNQACTFFEWSHPIFIEPMHFEGAANEVNTPGMRSWAIDRELQDIKSQIQSLKSFITKMFFMMGIALLILFFHVKRV